MNYKEIPAICLVAGGSNLPGATGDSHLALKKAVKTLDNQYLKVVLVSQYYQTAAMPKGSGPDFVNMAVLLHSFLPPKQTLEQLHKVEQAFGRLRDKRWGPRTLDLDLIDYQCEVHPDPEVYSHWRDLGVHQQQQQSPRQLVLPHPRMQDRAFVLVPLRDVAPDWVHPVLGQTADQMLANLPPEERDVIRPV